MIRQRAVVPLTACWLAALALAAAASAAAGEPPPLLAPLADGVEVELPRLDASIPAPAARLGYPLGARFTRQAAMLAYLEELAAVSPRVALWRYGESYEGRPLVMLAISSPENLERLEGLRRRHQKLAEPAALVPAELERLLAGQPAMVWLSYGLHGNESSSSEAAIATAYVLAAAAGEWARRLQEVVVLLDPLANPDGRERYVHGFEQRRGRRADPRAWSFEHAEPWPGGRTNHYLVDLNRDWAWASQQETRHRLAEYRRWEPQVHVDVHEMASDSTYFFPPPAEPVHPAIDPRVLAWLGLFGRANAAAFEPYGWIFYSRQRFDLFYPGYGDSYPSLRGAVGMTYEMAGGGRAGERLELADGSLRTLADRVARHLVTSLATVATVAGRRTELLESFVAARRDAGRRPVSFLFDAGGQEARALAELLRLHGVAVWQLAGDAELTVRRGDGGGEQRRRFAAGSWVVSTDQPLGGLVAALLNRNAPLGPELVAEQRRRVEENLPAQFFDITAWSLPLAFNLECWEVDGPLPVVVSPAAATGGIEGEGDLGFAVPPQGLAGYRFAARLLAAGVRFRFAVAPLDDGATGALPRGTLFVPRRGNGDELETELARLAAELGVRVLRLGSRLPEAGVAPGSDDLLTVRRPRVGLAAGPGVSPASLGHLWHLLDREVQLEHSRFGLDRLAAAVDELDVVILPAGEYGQRWGEDEAAVLEGWIEGGGVVVAVGSALDWLRRRGLSKLERRAGSRDAGDGDGEDAESPPSPPRRVLFTPGAALATEMLATHPLTAGLEAPPPVLYRGSVAFEPAAARRHNILTVAEERPVLSGLAWSEAEELLAGSLLVADEPRGRGRVVSFAQDPAFRLFWRATMPLFLNAVFYGPSY